VGRDRVALLFADGLQRLGQPRRGTAVGIGLAHGRQLFGGVEELAASVGAVLHIGDERRGQQRRPEVVDGLREARESEPADLPALCELR